MFGIGPIEILVIAVVILVFVGPQRLPELMKQFGKFFVHARRYSSDIRSSFDDVVREAEREMRLDEAEKLRQKIRSEIDKVQGTISLDSDAKDDQPKVIDTEFGDVDESGTPLGSHEKKELNPTDKKPPTNE